MTYYLTELSRDESVEVRFSALERLDKFREVLGDEELSRVIIPCLDDLFEDK